jgi:hypothetical protein
MGGGHSPGDWVTLALVEGPPIVLTPANTVLARGEGDR